MAAGLQTYVEFLDGSDFDDLFHALLASWSMLLLTLGAEALFAIISLTKQGRRRIAYALTRTLIEYHVRLSYYAVDIEQYAKPWREGKIIGPADVGLTKTEAFRDWFNMPAKMLHNLRNTPWLDLSELDKKTRKRFQKMMDTADDVRLQKWQRMLKKGIGNHKIRKTFAAEYSLTSAYLHGDQLASYEMIVGTRDTGSPIYKSMFSEVRVVGSAMATALQLMARVGIATGRFYGYFYFDREMSRLFHDH